MKQIAKRLYYIVGDALLCVLTMYASIWLRFEGNIEQRYLDNMWFYMLVAVITVCGSGAMIGSYNGMWEYWGLSDTLRQIICTGVSGSVFLIIKYSGLAQMINPDMRISGSITVIYCFLILIMTVVLRTIPRFRQWMLSESSARRNSRAIIIGAGTTGAMLVKRMQESAESTIYPVAIVDNDAAKRNFRLAGVTIGGGVDDIPDLARKYKANEAVLALPNICSADLSEIYRKCSDAGLRLRIFRDSVDAEALMSGNKYALRDVSIEDLLFRDTIRTDMSDVFAMLQDKTVLVTGGAGSIGSEICRQVLENGCGRLVIFDIHENGLFEINEELKDRFDQSKYVLVVGSVRDRQKLDQVFSQFKPDLVLHAAAHKHVPMMELNPVEAVKNNVLGTLNVLETAVEHSTPRCILISTDKAVHPTNIMGATKRVAELLAQNLNSDRCRIAAVRFGNVLGSNGSVVPIFRRQIAEGGPVTVTHKDIVRYFMTIPEAVSLVLTAGTIAKGGEVFLLDMGKPVRIYDLAVDLIKLSGLKPGTDVKIEITGLRPGEKLYEELVQDNEQVKATVHEKIFMCEGHGPQNEKLRSSVEKLRAAIESGADGETLRNMTFEAIEETQSAPPVYEASAAHPNI